MSLSEQGRPIDEQEDQSLVRAFLRGRHEQVFRALYRRHTAGIYAIVLRIVRGNERDAEEIIQTTWMRAIERLEQFRWESTLRTWLTGIALNCARERRRERWRSEASDPSIELDALPATRAAPATLNRIDLERAIERLPDGYREVLILHDVAGYTHGEIGALLGIASGTSKSQLARARQRVLTRLCEPGEKT